jgi:hypothetical protein
MDSVAAVGTTSKYAREDHVHPSDTTKAALTQVVRYDAAQSLTVAQQVQARQNIFAAPFDAMAYSGMQINGSMEVNQEGVTASVHNKYFCDGWKMLFAGTAVVTAQQFGAVFFLAGLNYAATITVSTAQASLGAGDFVGMYQGIEGWRSARLGWGTASAQPLTIAFWSRHSRAGTYSGSLRNGAFNRCYAFTYTQAAVDTPQYNVITIPGDTTGTWAADNTGGMYLSFSNGSGSTQTAPSANTWLAGSYLAAPGQVNGVAATSDFFRLTGVVVLPGIEAPSAARAPLIMRPYDQELLTCRRYFCGFGGLTASYAPFFGYSITTTQALIWCPFPVEMRAYPTFSFDASNYTLVNNVNNNAAITSASINSASPKSAMLLFGSSGAQLGSGAPCRIQSSAYPTGNFNFDARL